MGINFDEDVSGIKLLDTDPNIAKQFLPTKEE